jgi:hypothetical protein
MQAGLAVKPITSAAWEAIRQVRVGTNQVKEANIKQLRRDFSNITFKASKTVEDFSLRLNTMASQLHTLMMTSPTRS